MKKYYLLASFLMLSLLSMAQSDSLQVYTGKYKFPEGSPVTEIGVVIENGVLTATSAMGNSELRATSTKDVFEVVAYSGTATFKRSEDGKVKMLRIQVQDVEMEGVKEGSLIFLQSNDKLQINDIWYMNSCKR